MFVSPMLLLKASDNLPFDDDSWITELKADGIRLIYTRFNGVTKLYTRHNTEVTNRFKELLNLPIPDNIVLDGEIIVSDEEGKPNFEYVMERFQSTKSQHKVTYMVFDILYFEGKKVTYLPLVERKELLEEVVPEDTDQLTKVKWMYGSAVAYFDVVKQHGLEGIVQKKANSKYNTGKRTHDWLKVINYSYADVYISGYRKDKFGLLLQSKHGLYVGVMEFMSKQDRKTFYMKQKEYVKSETDKYVYLEPKIKARVKYRNLTSKGLFRIPSFVEWAN